MVIKLCLMSKMFLTGCNTYVLRFYKSWIPSIPEYLCIVILSYKVSHTNDDFVSLECQAFLHKLYSISHLLCISSVICCITGSPFLFLFCPLPFQSYRRSHQVWLPSYCHKDQLLILSVYFQCLKDQPLPKKNQIIRKALELKMYRSGTWYSPSVDSSANIFWCVCQEPKNLILNISRVFCST